ncbi:Fic family protein [Candidatus Saccharibacteria bacterium]|nr:Fic family protein [Candidatus Saccharibacteria bacterium]
MRAKKSVKQIAEKWQISERQVRDFCENGRIKGAEIINGSWQIPETAEKPVRKNRAAPPSLLEILRREDDHRIRGGIYHKVQIELTYNSNHIEGSTLTHNQTRYIFETNTILPEGKFKGVKTDDIIETANHFRCIDYIIENTNRHLTENLIKNLHFMLKNGTSDSLENWFNVGDYKKLPNEVGGLPTTPPEKVKTEMKNLLNWYNELKRPSLNKLLEFHYRFEKIHPFQDGNGRIGRLILFKECLGLGIVPFIIDDDLKLFYYRGLNNWPREKGYLKDTCLTAQDRFKTYLDYFEIPY